MKILFSSDWQVQASNFPQIDAVTEEIVEAIKTQGIDAFVHCGDIKHTINPIDGRVINKTLAAITRIQKAGAEVFFNLGNHDKLAMSEDAANWFEPFRRIGVHGMDTPGFLRLSGRGPEFRLFFLPYMSAGHTLAAADAFRRDKPTPKDSALVFHTSITKAKINTRRVYEGEDAIPLAELLPTRYMAVIGGHFHMQQQLGPNAYYVGSPFPTDWGEANQAKGYLILDTKTGKVTPLASNIPQWFDPTWPGFTAPQSWAGASVRIHVPIAKDETNVGAVIKAATLKAEAKYKGAHIVAVPEVKSRKVEEEELGIDEDSDDSEVIRAWLAASRPDELAADEAKLLAYLKYHLQQVAGITRSRSGFQLHTLTAANMLSFEKLFIDYRKPKGLRLISGENEDWPGRSNGSGKSSYLQLLAVILTGRSLKGQRADALRRRGMPDKGESWGKLTGKLGDGRMLEIYRGRKPKGVFLKLDGKDASTGIGEDGVNAEIERLTGISADTLANAIFMDQRDLNGLLSGKDADRKRIFASFANLERFEKALKTLKAERDKASDAAEMIERDMEVFEGNVEQLMGFLATLRKKSESDAAAAKEQLAAARKELDAAKRDELGKREAVTVAKKEEERLGAKVDKAYDAAAAIETQWEERERELQRFTSRNKAGQVCSFCQQKISAQTVERHTKEIRDAMKKLAAELVGPKAKLRACKKDLETATAAREKAEKVHRASSDRRSRASATVEQAERRVEEATAPTEEEAEYRKKLKKAEADLRAERKALKAAKHELLFTTFAVRAFAKDGVPAYIAGLFCPRLNASAAYYSQLFGDGEIAVEFRMDGEDIAIDIVNPNGGERLGDQSNGETRIASHIVSFALCDLLSPLNVLFADEPGEGLDEVNARQFAKGLREMVSRFSTVLVTTHNPFILAELSDVPQVVVTKRNGISSVTSKSS
jgi:DNA repair exonuclease SbcCD nuclease subunit/energy-coupling factor transporter ATP-binding protein EcfA2